MTDPILAALLADPTPTGRLVAADRASELGEDLLEAWLRFVVFAPTVPLSGLDTRLNAAGRFWRLVVRGCWMGFGMPVQASRWAGPRGRIIHNWGPQSGWTDGTDAYSPPLNPPPGLEAAVLAVLRRRLEEMRLSL